MRINGVERQFAIAHTNAMRWSEQKKREARKIFDSVRPELCGESKMSPTIESIEREAVMCLITEFEEGWCLIKSQWHHYNFRHARWERFDPVECLVSHRTEQALAEQMAKMPAKGDVIVRFSSDDPLWKLGAWINIHGEALRTFYGNRHECIERAHDMAKLLGKRVFVYEEDGSPYSPAQSLEVEA